MRGGPFLIQCLAAAAVAAAFLAPTGPAFVPATSTTPPRRPSSLSPQAGPRRASRLWCELCGDDGKRHDDDDRGEERDVTSSKSLFLPETEDDEARNPVPPDPLPLGAGEGKEPAALGGAMINFIKVRDVIMNPIRLIDWPLPGAAAYTSSIVINWLIG
jgi:hypothetical protein